MISITTEKKLSPSAFVGATRLPGCVGPSWLDATRESAMKRFEQLGFPTTRQEEWRFTNIEPIATTRFKPSAEAPGVVTEQDLAGVSTADFGGCRLVFVNGRYAPRLSRPAGLESSFTATGLTQVLKAQPDRVRPYLTQYARYDNDAFTALNTAFIEDGAFIYVPRGVSIDGPIHLLYVSTTGSEPTIEQPRNLVIAEAGSRFSVVEDYVSLDAGVTFTNAVTELAVGEQASVTHYLIGRQNRQTFNVSSLEVRQGRGSNFTSHSTLWGGALVRNNVHPVLDGEGCESLLNGLYVVDGQQLIDNHMRVEHAQPHCHSRQFYKGILNGHGRAVFSGRIVVHPGAQKTDAKQNNMNLLLSDDAQVNTKPQLEIYADDVKCTHGATVGQIDENAVFYLRSRGVSEETARAMMVYAFAAETLERMNDEPIRVFVAGKLLELLPGSETLRSVF